LFFGCVTLDAPLPRRPLIDIDEVRVLSVKRTSNRFLNEDTHTVLQRRRLETIAAL